MPRHVYQPGSRSAYRGWGGGRALVGAAPITGRYVDEFTTQLTTLGASRGTDRVPTPPQNIPRTTNDDVAKLVTAWSAALHRDGGKDPSVLAILISPIAAILDTETAGDESGSGLARAAREWRGEEYWVAALASAGAPDAVYVRNAQLWHAMQTLAVELDAIAEAPSKFDLAKDATVKAVKNLPNTLESVGKYALIGAGVIGAAIILAKLMENK